MNILSYISHHFISIFATYGYAAVFTIIGLESIGIPLPGETTLLAAAIYAGTTHHLNIFLIILFAASGAIVGDNIGYWVGREGGYPLLRQYGKLIKVDEKRLKLGWYLFYRYGGRVVFIGRFISILRMWAALLAGVNNMEWKRFLLYNALGGIVWASIYGGIGYFLGRGIHEFGGTIKILSISIGILIFILTPIYIGLHEKKLTEEAEKKFPGSLEEYRNG